MAKVDGCQIFKSFLYYNHIINNHFTTTTTTIHSNHHGIKNTKVMKPQNLTTLKNNIYYYNTNRKRCSNIESLKANKNSKYLSEDDFKKKLLKAQEYLKNKSSPESTSSSINTNQSNQHMILNIEY